MSCSKANFVILLLLPQESWDHWLPVAEGGFPRTPNRASLRVEGPGEPTTVLEGRLGRRRKAGETLESHLSSQRPGSGDKR